MLGPSRVTGCHAAALKLPVPPNLLGGQQCQLALGASGVSAPLSGLGAQEAWSKEATAAASAAAAPAAPATSEEEQGPQHRLVSPRDVLHDPGGPGRPGAGHVSALPPAEGAGGTQRGKPASGWPARGWPASGWPACGWPACGWPTCGRRRAPCRGQWPAPRGHGLATRFSAPFFPS